MVQIKLLAYHSLDMFIVAFDYVHIHSIIIYIFRPFGIILIDFYMQNESCFHHQFFPQDPPKTSLTDICPQIIRRKKRPCPLRKDRTFQTYESLFLNRGDRGEP